MSALTTGLLIYLTPSGLIGAALLGLAIEQRIRGRRRTPADCDVCAAFEPEFTDSPRFEQLADLYLIPTEAQR